MSRVDATCVPFANVADGLMSLTPGSSGLQPTPILGGHFRYTEPDELKSQVTDFIDTIRPIIPDFLTKSRSTWSPPSTVDSDTREFYDKLAIPRFHEKLSLLFHGLGKLRNPAAEALFSGSRYR